MSRKDYCDDCNSNCDGCQYNELARDGENLCGDCANFKYVDSATGIGICTATKNYGTTSKAGDNDDCFVPKKKEAKADKGKLRLSLVPPEMIEDVAQIRMYGTEKYGDPNNWKKVSVERYTDALLRHLMQFLRDQNSKDEESGIEHYKHIACNAAFICALMRGEKNEI